MKFSNKISSSQLGFLQVALGAILWATYGLFVRNLSYPSGVIVFFRFFFGFLTLLVITIFSGKLYWSQSIRRWKGLLLAGVLCALSWHAYTFALVYTSVANAVFLLYTAPCFVVFLAPLLVKEKLEKTSVVALAICLTGSIIMMRGEGFHLGNAGWLGDAIGLSGGVFYALSILAVKRLPAEILGFTSNAYISLIITITAIPAMIPYLHMINPMDLPILFVMGAVLQGIASSLCYLGLAKIKAQEASILYYFEPFSSVIFAFMFLGESLTSSVLAGGLLIITGGLFILIKPQKVSNRQRLGG